MHSTLFIGFFVEPYYSLLGSHLVCKPLQRMPSCILSSMEPSKSRKYKEPEWTCLLQRYPALQKLI